VFFPIIKLWHDFSPLILLCCSPYGGCTLSTYTQVDEEYMWDVLEGGDEGMPSV